MEQNEFIISSLCENKLFLNKETKQKRSNLTPCFSCISFVDDIELRKNKATLRFIARGSEPIFRFHRLIIISCSKYLTVCCNSCRSHNPILLMLTAIRSTPGLQKLIWRTQDTFHPYKKMQRLTVGVEAPVNCALLPGLFSLKKKKKSLLWTSFLIFIFEANSKVKKR